MSTIRSTTSPMATTGCSRGSPTCSRQPASTATFSSAQGLTFQYGDMDAAGLAEVSPMVMLDPPEHTEFRRQVARAFTPRRVQSLEPVIRGFVAERLERLRDGGDVVAEVFKPLPSMVVAHFLGVPAADRERFDGWTDAIVAASAEGDVLAAPQAVGELFEYFGDLIERRRRSPGDDTISQLLSEDRGEDLQAVPAMRMLGFAFTMVAGGNDTTTGMLGGSSELLTERRDQRRLLLEDPELIGDAVDELLRLTSPVQGLARTTTREVEIGGTKIPEGRKVLLVYASANRDPREFGDDAEELRVERRPRQIMSFGYGAHHCLGAAVARLQARVALEELLATFPEFEVDASRGEFAPGNYVRRYRSLPFVPGSATAP
ncbi:MAG: cytochrome P450 [Microthrixaceae bacterium]